MTKQSSYMFNIDDGRELARLSLQDSLFNEIIPRFPPLFVPHRDARILDVACATGAWALQVAQAFPDASIYGVDISTLMIQYARAQAQARKLEAQFRVMDISKYPWDFPDEYFNLINARFISGCIPARSWPQLLYECKRLLKAGGTFRSVEAVHLATPTSPSVTEMSRLAYAVMYKRGISFSAKDMTVSPVVARLLRQMGFDVTTVPYMADLSYGAPLHDSLGEDLSMASRLLGPLIMQEEGIGQEKLADLLQGWDQEWGSSAFVAHWHLSGISGVKG